ncbi:hypothetical protein [Lishizhenia sp.]|uniref:hypothetical protein n=1 Tax=Lishizhenia sp. TaxID=2497594 RepID=UPI00299CDACB|nr:hypothetical protein [Lishizhenia sp.]MDX1444613.1 hypothetical protein [Lishizhenia sp.]
MKIAKHLSSILFFVMLIIFAASKITAQFDFLLITSLIVLTSLVAYKVYQLKEVLK